MAVFKVLKPCQMKLLTKLFLFIGLFFGGGIGLFYSLFNLIALNGIGNYFQVKSPEIVDVRIEQDSVDVYIEYNYKVGESEYSSEYKMFAEYYNRCDIDTVVVKYNETFPAVSYIEGVSLKIRKQKNGYHTIILFYPISFVAL